MKTIVITGSTGVFGRYLVNNLLKREVAIILLVRADSQRQAENKVNKLLDLSLSAHERLKILKCSLIEERLGLSSDEYELVKQNTTHILHAAASTKFTLPLEEARRNNVLTTKRLLSFAEDCHNLRRFGFMSTAFVAGKRSGVILEAEFKHRAGFLNTYEESKYEAELVVRSMINRLPIVIFRPSLILTPYKKSGISPVNALTLGLYLARKGFLPILPGSEKNKLDIVEGTDVAQAVTKILLKETVRHTTYHISSFQHAPTLQQLLNLIKQQSEKLPVIRFCGDMESYSLELKKVTRFRPDLGAIYKKTQSFLPELAFPKMYDNRNLLNELGINAFSEKPIDHVESLLK